MQCSYKNRSLHHFQWFQQTTIVASPTKSDKSPNPTNSLLNPNNNLIANSTLKAPSSVVSTTPYLSKTARTKQHRAQNGHQNCSLEAYSVASGRCGHSGHHGHGVLLVGREQLRSKEKTKINLIQNYSILLHLILFDSNSFNLQAYIDLFYHKQFSF